MLLGAGELRDLVMKIRADFISHVVREGTFTVRIDGTPYRLGSPRLLLVARR